MVILGGCLALALGQVLLLLPLLEFARVRAVEVHLYLVSHPDELGV